DGTLDPTFGKGGKVTTEGLYGCSGANALVLQPDGKLVAAGWSRKRGTDPSAGVLIRYNADGSVDRGFGKRGKGTSMLEAARGLVLQSDSKLVQAGESGSSDTPVCALIRYTRSGAPDPTFGKAGKATTAPSLGSCSVDATAGQRDGKLVAASYIAGLLLR